MKRCVGQWLGQAATFAHTIGSKAATALIMNIGREGLGQQFLIFGVRDLNRPKLARVIVQDLRIAQAKPVLAQPFGMMYQRDFAGIAFARKHAFAREQPTDRHPIAAAD